MVTVIENSLGELCLGGSMIDPCDRCGTTEVVAWINREDEHTGQLAVSVYLCRACLLEALRRTFEEGTPVQVQLAAIRDLLGETI